MDLSVCIVSYNCRDALRDCLASIQRTATGLEHEIIVADNASDDGTLEMLANEFGQVVCLANDENLGLAAATNRAMGRASGDFLMMLDPDTEVQPGALEHLIAFLRGRPWVGAVGARLTRPDGELEPTCHPFPSLALTLYAQLALHRLFPRSSVFGAYDMTWWDHAAPRRVDWVSGACLAVSREAWEQVGDLDEEYSKCSQEIDWCYRLAQEGLECWYLPEAKVIHHEAASWSSTSRERILASQRSNLRFFGKHYGRAPEVLARLMVASGAVVRGNFWNIAGPLLAKPPGIITDPHTHSEVANQALRFEQLYREPEPPAS